MIVFVAAASLILQAGAPTRVLEARVREIISVSAAEVAVAYRTLDGTRELLIDADKPFHAASTMKVPVMIDLFRQSHDGRLSLDDRIVIRNEFHSLADGSTFTLSVGDDSDAVVYAAAGQMSVAERSRRPWRAATGFHTATNRALASPASFDWRWASW